jgi:ornithine cyclodeaminase/alanine dehydrogenase-like protein (mu-crystallin family)
VTLLLSSQQAAELLDLEQAIDVMEGVLREQAEDTVVAIPPRHVPVRRGGALRIVSGALLDRARMGVRVGPAAALASNRATALLYDSESGDLLCIMGYPFGTLRTGASMGLATRHLAREDARTLAMIGTGRNALSLITAAANVRPLERVRVFSRTPARREDLAQRAQEALGIPAAASETAEEAVQGADLVYVSTDSSAPAVSAAWLSPGTFVATMGRPSEIDPCVYVRADLVVVGQKKHEEEYFDAGQYRHSLLEVVKQGRLSWDAVRELCDIVTDRAPGRRGPDDVIIFKESQGGFSDIALAATVYERARASGAGQEFALS